MQLMAYGILVEQEFGTRPEYGLLKYHDEVFEIEFTDDSWRRDGHATAPGARSG